MDLILIDNDIVLFMPVFGAATVVVKAGKLKATGKSSLGGKMVCIDGDEKKVEVPGCAYITPVYSIPGTGTLKILALAGDQKAKKTKSGGKVMLLKGTMFTAVFEVQSPAKQPPPNPGPPIPDATPKYTGKGSFITGNIKYKGT